VQKALGVPVVDQVKNTFHGLENRVARLPEREQAREVVRRIGTAHLGMAVRPMESIQVSVSEVVPGAEASAKRQPRRQGGRRAIHGGKLVQMEGGEGETLDGSDGSDGILHLLQPDTDRLLRIDLRKISLN
jgi:hypothetical protein